mmetsp:Transcript_20954/g.70867  ORF Transcript_20954/g.70867 Transcript_20954/m.70867 type:complete len:250 (+) Transcript_20954:692-1441(+)
MRSRRSRERPSSHRSPCASSGAARCAHPSSQPCSVHPSTHSSTHSSTHPCSQPSSPLPAARPARPPSAPACSPCAGSSTRGGRVDAGLDSAGEEKAAAGASASVLPLPAIDSKAPSSAVWRRARSSSARSPDAPRTPRQSESLEQPDRRTIARWLIFSLSPTASSCIPSQMRRVAAATSPSCTRTKSRSCDDRLRIEMLPSAISVARKHTRPGTSPPREPSRSSNARQREGAYSTVATLPASSKAARQR